MTGIIREERIGGQRLLQGDCLEIMPGLGEFDHIISDPPYEASLHNSKNAQRGRVRVDNGPDLQGLDFAPIDAIRSRYVELAYEACSGWFISFCTIEGVDRWAAHINPSQHKYKRACLWIKPDSTPQLNGQCPAQGAECFVCAWSGSGHSKWNAGGKRGVYTHLTNNKERHGRHPTEKPVSLMAEILCDFTNQEQTVLDPFMGSGTTLVACQRLGRSGTGVELDPDYFQIACERVHEEWRQPRMDLAVPKATPAEQLNMLDGGAA